MTDEEARQRLLAHLSYTAMAKMVNAQNNHEACTLSAEEVIAVLYSVDRMLAEVGFPAAEKG